MVILPAIGAVETRRDFAAALRATVRDPAQVHTVPALDYGTVFYWGGAMPVFDPTAGGEDPAYLLMPEPMWARAPAALRERFARLVGVGGDDDPAVLERRAPPAPEAGP